MSNSTRCAACKSLRRRCAEDCVLAPYFPSTNPQRFSSVHKIFGASNVTKMLQRLPVHQRSEAADCMSLEASWRVQDPVYGCVGVISQLQQQILVVQSELAKTQGEIAFHNAQQHQTQFKQEPVGGIESLIQFGQPSSSTNINGNQEDMINNLDQQPFLDFLNH
ncbi:hypothetical protein MKW94_017511 [Papaver nudicaule]|uniref:LOB domain-containing protein n=1 Tax=Papaver nudicaule TaxID=74823 RepID=A0AA41VYK1_PAPNU|nr:hypothetical protein [Papaver nudicaule]